MLLSQAIRRRLNVFIFGLLIFVFLTVFRLHRSASREHTLAERLPDPSQVQSPAQKSPIGSLVTTQECPPAFESLRKIRLDISDSVYYSRRCIRPTWGKEVNRNDVVKLKEPLIPRKSLVNASSCRNEAELPPCDSLYLTVPYPYPKEKFPDLLFGVATNFARLEESLDGFKHWLSGTDAQLLVVIMDADGESGEARLSSLQELYQSHGINIKAKPPRIKALGVAQNHFAILAELVEAATPETKWLGIIDDDTFFPSLHRLRAALNKYDHTTPTWLGALSEDFDVVKWLGIMAFGGAGTFLSLPLAHELAPHMEACLSLPRAVAKNATGDGLLRDCIFEYTSTKLKIVDGLYQHDLRGDVSGFYESGVQPVSVHHWRSWYKLPMPAMAAVTKVCGDCFLQRWQFGEDTLFANGYSVTQYVKGLKNVDLEQMEGTWSNPGHEFDFSLGPLRPALDEIEKKSYRLLDAESTHDGMLRQLYVHKSWVDGEPDHVLEFIWERDGGLLH